MEWNRLIGKSPRTIYSMQGYVHEFLLYLEKRNHSEINSVTVEDVRDHICYLQLRANQRRSGALSINTINGHITAIKRFKEYLKQAHGINLFFEINFLVKPPTRPTVLNTEEIGLLYDAARSQTSILSLRDIVLLDLFYACGVRRSEGAAIDITDIYLEQRLVHIRKGKGAKQRYIPFTPRVAKHFVEYIESVRPFIIGTERGAFLISIRGTRFTSQGIYDRILQLQKKSGHPGLKSKSIGVHTLRHSIATHLLHAGMPLKHIARFLGHSTLQATQVYTHLVHELNRI